MLSIIYFMTKFLSFLNDFLFPHSILGEWLSELTTDTALLRRGINGMKSAASKPEPLLEKTLADFAYDVGYQQCYGLLNQRILQSWLILALNMGNDLHQDLWDSAWIYGYNDAYDFSLVAGCQLA